MCWRPEHLAPLPSSSFVSATTSPQARQTSPLRARYLAPLPISECRGSPPPQRRRPPQLPHDSHPPPRPLARAASVLPRPADAGQRPSPVHEAVPGNPSPVLPAAAGAGVLRGPVARRIRRAPFRARAGPAARPGRRHRRRDWRRHPGPDHDVAAHCDERAVPRRRLALAHAAVPVQGGRARSHRCCLCPCPALGRANPPFALASIARFARRAASRASTAA
jgi:hypothetical protein